MGFDIAHHHEPDSTPKLTLSRLPYCKPLRSHPPQMQTPPLRSAVSIPFRWEEAPGKPKSAADAEFPDGGATLPPSPKNRASGMCLDLPPRLMMSHDDAKITIMPSPTTVLDGPYVGRSLSLACTFSFRRGLVSSREDGLRPNKRGGGGLFGSGRWGSSMDEGKFGRGDLDFSYSLGEILRSEENVKTTRVKKRRSFFRFSGINSNMWGDIYASLSRRFRGGVRS
ncbi:hypothetical protein OROHE_025148 [Orobanche hederae]